MMSDYKRCVKICDETDYSDVNSVKKHNDSVSEMREIVKKSANNQKLFTELCFLLDDTRCAGWLSFQFLELCNVNKDIEGKCLIIIEEITKSSGVKKMGAQMWLKQYHKNRLA